MTARQVTIDGGVPWGFRMHGGADAQLPLRIARVNPGSKAAQRGIREGDIISTINGTATRSLTNAEAHALLRSAGDTLVLGLNQEVTGSPKRRSQKLAQETKDENVRKTIATSSSSSVSLATITNVSNLQSNNETVHTNGVSDIKTEDTKSNDSNSFKSHLKKDSPFNSPHVIGATAATNIPTVESRDAKGVDTSSQPSNTNTDTTATSDGNVVITANSECDKAVVAAVIMADNVSGSSRSRKQRKSRANRRKSKKHTSNTSDTSVEPVESTDQQLNKVQSLELYKVEFPTIEKVSNEKKSGTMIKSRSLDDDDQVKITEVTEEEQSVSVTESTAIVSEAESDVEWETVSEFSLKEENSEQQFGKLSVISLPLEEHVTYETSHISPEDERSLRDFLEGLDLVSSPEDSAKRIEKNSSDSIKTKRAKKRAALAQHFFPYYQNPRYLDVISEEGSDLSDKDCKQNSTYVRCQLFDVDNEIEDDVFENNSNKEKLLQSKFQTKMSRNNDKAILVDTKLFDIPLIKEATWSTSMAESPSGAEVVYLDDSSNSRTPSDVPDLEYTVADIDADDEEDTSINLDKSYSESFQNEISSSEGSSLKNTNITLTSPSDTISRASLPADNESSFPFTPSNPSTPIKDSTQQTPSNQKNTIDFLQKLLSTLSTSHSAEIHIILEEHEAQNLPPQIKNKLKVLSETQDSNSTDMNKIKIEIENYQTACQEKSVLNEYSNIPQFSINNNSKITKDIALKEEIIDNDSLINNIERKTQKLLEQIKSETTLINDLTKKVQRSVIGKSEEMNKQNEKVLNHELNNQKQSLLADDEYSNQVDSSNTSQTSSTRSSQSRCTTVYNPLNSSQTNITTFLREDQDRRSLSVSPVSSPLASLRELCIRVVLSMPFGQDIIEELANVSLSIENITCGSPSQALPSCSFATVSDSQSSCILPVNTVPTVESERWVGLPSEEDPNVLICLSPSQKQFIEKTKSFPNEADSLLDLHRKYLSRRGYHEEFDLSKPIFKKEVPAFKISLESPTTFPYGQDNLTMLNNFKKTQKINEFDSINANGNIHYSTYIKQITREVPIQVEKQTNKPVNNLIYNGADLSDFTQRPSSSCDRLKARHLGEWLHMAKRNSEISNSSELSNQFSTANKIVSQKSYEERSSQVTETSTRRHSLPFALYEQQMQYILEKEKEIEQEIENLRKEKSKLENEMNESINTNSDNLPNKKTFDAGIYQISRKGDIAILSSENERPLSKSTASTSEKFREVMYQEYMCKVAERQERQQNKVIKIKISNSDDNNESELSPQYEVKHVCGIEDEFMNKVRERKGKLGIKDVDETDRNDEKSPVGDIRVLDGAALSDASRLPKHLQEFINITNTTSDEGIWSPGKNASTINSPPSAPTANESKPHSEKQSSGDDPPPVVWTPRSAGSSPTAERKEFRPVNFESPVLSRKNKSKDSTPVTTPDSASTNLPPPWESSFNGDKIDNSNILIQDRRLPTSHSAPAAGLNNLGKLPRAQNPTITLLQKAREGQLPRGASYIEDSQFTQKQRSKDNRPPLIGPNEILYSVKNEYMSESDSEKPKKMADLGSRKFEGIGPTTKDGMPIVLRSAYDYAHQEVKDANQAKWYKRMYDTLHRTKPDDEYVTVRYKTRRGRYPYTSAGGYLSEPEPNVYDSDASVNASKYATLDRRRIQPKDKENEYITYTVPRHKYMSASVRHSTDVYKNQPGRIENYVPGHSSISEKEAKEWWDEVMEIFDGWLDDHSALPSLNYMLSQVTATPRSHLEQQKHVPPNKSFMSQALKESGYESDSTLIFRRRDDTALQLSPHEQKEAYKNIQKGGEVPLHGLRKPAPERPKDDSEIEYFPISPTLTRIRVHKKPINEILCYPVTVHHQPSQIFSTYKRSAPSTITQSQSTKPPNPPKRRSSRNSHTLRLISTMTIHHPQSPKSSRRHETCFKTTESNSNVKFLRDRLSSKLKSPVVKKGMKVTKIISSCPSTSKESITTTINTSRGSTSKIKTKTDFTCKTIKVPESKISNLNTTKKCCHVYSSMPPKSSCCKTCERKNRSISLERTFGSEKHKVELNIPKSLSPSYSRLAKSTELLSPTEVKKGVQKQKDLLNLEMYPPGTTVKKTTSLFSSAKNGLKKVSKSDEKSLNVTAAFTPKGKELLNSNLRDNSNVKLMRSSSPSVSRALQNPIRSPTPSALSDRSKSSVKSRSTSAESLKSSQNKKRSNIIRPISISKIKTKSSSKKEDLLSDREKKKIKKNGKNTTTEELKKCKSKKIKDTKSNPNKEKTLESDTKESLSTKENKEIPVQNEQIIKKQDKEIYRSDSFFQNLFLRDLMFSPIPYVNNRSSFISEKAKIFQNPPYSSLYTEPTVGALKVYLTHRKPVTESKFKVLEKEMMYHRSRSISPCYLNQTISDIRNKFDSISEISNEDLYIARHLSPESIYNTRRSLSLPSSKIIFSETSRPVSPCYDKALVNYNYRSTSPSPVRSPSRRKIDQIKPINVAVEGINGIKKKTVRARSAGEAESLRRKMYHMENSPSPSDSTISLSQITNPKDYKTYITELRYSTRKKDRFKELNNFYSSLERLSELERTTSSIELRPRRKNEEEIIDYDRWMQVRTRERAEQEFNNLYSKLKREQKEKDLLFTTRDVENLKWTYDKEFGLKVKENSVENIKEQFEKLKNKECSLETSNRHILDYQKDIYKPLWRGDSVLNLVSKITEKRSQSEGRMTALKNQINAEKLLTRQIGRKLWSSLSTEQVNTIKRQLTEIYSPDFQDKRNRYITVNSDSKNQIPKTLVIRRSSTSELTAEKENMKKNKNECVKSASIGAISSSHTISETEKKRLSQSLSREVKERLSQKKPKYKSTLSIVLAKETRGAIAAAEAQIKPKESTSPRTCYSLEPTEDENANKVKDDKKFVLVLAKDESEEQKQNISKTLNEWAQPKTETSVVSSKKLSSTSETESASSDTSTKTAIFVGSKEDLHKKIEYFEKGADLDTYVPTIYKPADYEEETTETDFTIDHNKNLDKKKLNNLMTSQSYSDFKELFGEKTLMKFATIPLSSSRKSTITTPKRPNLRLTNISPIRTVSETSSNESLIASRSMSPEMERFWNLYFTKGADVQKLTSKFENLTDFYSSRKTVNMYRRCKSDSELSNNNFKTSYEFGDVQFLKNQYENISRGRSRVRRHGKLSPIPKVPIRAEDRLMPHINIISKLASLYPKKQANSKQKTNDYISCPTVEVEKIREIFEPSKKISLLGHMFTSSPNVHELRDIAPYLAGSWIAHKYPKFQDNSRSASAPEENGTNQALRRKDRLRPKSHSPPRNIKKPSSILKPQQKDVFANQRFEPSIHRPIYRYQPQPPKMRTRSWSPITKHTVKFKEPISAPPPPPKGLHDFKDNPESPRRYVEDEVTIHYRSPVRHELKEALSEEELARRQAEAMRRIYQEERRRKYLQELQDMNSRRHTDNFIPSQKSPIPLNRYDDFIDDLSTKPRIRERSPEFRIVARALYNFVGQSARELTFRKGDIIFIRRQVDKNWYEGEHNAMVGLFPTNYVEIVPYDGLKSTPRKAHEGQARAKFNFIAQTHLELSLAKGELVVLTRRVDDNWFEGRIGSRKGIFPVSYVEVLIDPSDKQEISSTKPVASPAAHSLLLNGSAGGKESMGSHHYQPSYTSQQTTSYHAKPVNVIGTTTTYSSITRTQKTSTSPAVNEALHIDTQSEPIPYRALYKYRPQNDDELELQEGDTVFVLEKCDDGWYVGSSQRTGSFGTFPGNYVERI